MVTWYCFFLNQWKCDIELKKWSWMWLIDVYFTQLPMSFYAFSRQIIAGHKLKGKNKHHSYESESNRFIFLSLVQILLKRFFSAILVSMWKSLRFSSAREIIKDDYLHHAFYLPLLCFVDFSSRPKERKKNVSNSCK